MSRPEEGTEDGLLSREAPKEKQGHWVWGGAAASLFHHLKDDSVDEEADRSWKSTAGRWRAATLLGERVIQLYPREGFSASPRQQRGDGL